MRLASITEQVGPVSEKVYDRMSIAGEAARRGAQSAYHMALEHPRSSAAAGIILAAALVGGVLWYVFGNQRSAPRRATATHLREGTARRKRVRRARAAAAG